MILPGLAKHDHNRDVVGQQPQQPYLRDGAGLQDDISSRRIISHLTERLQLPGLCIVLRCYSSFKEEHKRRLCVLQSKGDKKDDVVPYQQM